VTINPYFAHASQLRSGGARLLASVATPEEAKVAIAAGADVIDAKDPSRGALGALDSATLRAIRSAVPPTIPLSATTGDLPIDQPELIVNEVARVAAASVDVVKIGFFGPACASRLIAALALRDDEAHAYGRRVAVLLADRSPDWGLVARLPAAGFSGVMLDTEDKASGALLDVVSRQEIETFITAARSVGMFAGLAGALRLRHIPEVRAFGPDVVGFRGALCRHTERTARIDVDAVREIRAALQGDDMNEKLSRAAAPPE